MSIDRRGQAEPLLSPPPVIPFELRSSGSPIISGDDRVYFLSPKSVDFTLFLLLGEFFDFLVKMAKAHKDLGG